jgi:hypothetical protein
MSCNDLRRRSITAHNKPIGNTTQPFARPCRTNLRSRQYPRYQLGDQWIQVIDTYGNYE